MTQPLTRLVALASLLLPATAHAQEEVLLDTVIVTAAGRPQSLADVQASVQVIDGTALRSGGAANVTEVLRQAVGLDARSSGSNESITIRGQKDSGTLILIDGQPRTGKYGGFGLNNFPVSDIERVEIVRGPMSALYGADALGGVVNIITRRPGDAPGKSVSVLLGVRPDDGERQTLNLATSAEFGDSTLGHRLSLDLRRSGGYALPTSLRGQDFSAMNRLALAWSGSWVPAEGQELRWRLEAYRQRDSRDAFVARTGLPYDALEQEDRISLDTSWTQDLGAGTLTVSGLLSYSDGMANRAFPTEEVTRAAKARVQARYDLTVGDHLLSFAAGAQQDRITVTGYTARVRETQLFALAQDEWLISDAVSMTFGARYDHFEAFGGTFNPRVVIGSRGDGLTWRVGGGAAFRAPGLSERFSRIQRGVGLIVGNPNLKPETAVSAEAAIGWRGAAGTVELVYHDSRVKDLITTVATGRVENGLSVTDYINVNRARIRGLELTGSWQATAALQLNGSLEYLDARDGQTGARLTGRYRTAWRLGATYATGPWEVAGHLRGMAGYWAANSDVNPLRPYGSGFTTVDVNVGYALSDMATVNLGIENLFDRTFDPNYSTSRYREDAGRFVYVRFDRRF